MRDIDHVELDAKGRLDIGIFWSMAFEKIVVLTEVAFQYDRNDQARDHWTLTEILCEYFYEINDHLKKLEK